MSINVNFFDANGNLTVFAATAGETFAQILQHPDVKEWFEAGKDLDDDDIEAGEDIVDYISEINDEDVEGNDTIINMILRGNAQDGDSISFNFYANTDAEDMANQVGGNGDEAEGASGVAIVSIAGGLQTARINITNGVTTVRAAIFNDTVRARSGMTDRQLEEATVMYKGRLLSANEMQTVRVYDADIIDLAPRVAATKG